MPKRAQPAVKPWIYAFLVLRDGEVCHYCGITLPEMRARAAKRKYMPEVFDIDHYDGDHNNNDKDNLRLACRKCNVARENQRRANPKSYVCVPDEPYRLKESGSQTRLSRQTLINSNDISAVMLANLQSEPIWRDWIYDQVKKNGFISRNEAIYAGAEICGRSPETVKSRYLPKVTSSAGILMYSLDMMKESVIVFKPEYEPRKADE